MSLPNKDWKRLSWLNVCGSGAEEVPMSANKTSLSDEPLRSGAFRSVRCVVQHVNKNL